MLEIIFAVPQTLWKHHKSKDQKILHRSYTPKFFLNSEKNYFFRVQKKIGEKIDQKFSEKKSKKKICKNPKISKFEKSKISIFRILRFSNFFRFFFRIFFWNFFGRFFSENFLNSEKKIFFGVEIFFGYSFDVKFSDLSIYDVFRAFGVRQILFPAPTRCTTLCLRAPKTWCFGGS